MMMLKINKKKTTKIRIKKILMMMMMIIIYLIKKKDEKIIRMMEIAKTSETRIIFMTVIPTKRIPFLIRKNLKVNFLILMDMDFGLDIYPHIHLEWLVAKMLLGISSQD